VFKLLFNKARQANAISKLIFMSPKANLVLNISCLGQAGIVAAVTDHFSQLNFSIVESSQHQDIFNDRFFMRMVYRHLADQPLDVEQIKQGFSPIAELFQMTWTLHSSGGAGQGINRSLQIRALPQFLVESLEVPHNAT
jgi:predicted amino acid-binding ACT domain protein